MLGLNPGRPHGRQAPFSLYYYSSPAGSPSSKPEKVFLPSHCLIPLCLPFASNDPDDDIRPTRVIWDHLPLSPGALLFPYLQPHLITGSGDQEGGHLWGTSGLPIGSKTCLKARWEGTATQRLLTKAENYLGVESQAPHRRAPFLCTRKSMENVQNERIRNVRITQRCEM